MSSLLYILLALLPVALVFGVVLARAAEPVNGLWLSARKDSRNQARADVAGRMKNAPREVWHMETGGSVNSARNVTVGGERMALVHVGSALELTRWDGESVWRNSRLGVTGVLHVGDFDGRGEEEVLVGTGSRSVTLLDLASGTELWSWESEPSTFVGGFKFHRTPGGIRFICFPSYSLSGYCFDFSGRRDAPRLLWQNDYTGKYGKGYGPVIVLKDMDRDGRPEILLSSKIPNVYQAILDIDTGEIENEIYYDPEPGSAYPVGRPYGLLHAVPFDPSRHPDVVIISCQVEEYIGVASNAGGGRLEKLWGKFVEKDWPDDEKELRPQITSLADLRGDGVIELVVGVWDEEVWRTLIIDPRRHYLAQRGRLEGYYFWGCYDIDGDGSAEIIVSTESRRRTASVTTLIALSGRSLEPVAELTNAAIFTSSDSPLPEEVSFQAIRSNPVYLQAADGMRGILVHRFGEGEESGTFLWGGAPGQSIHTRRLTGSGWHRADLHDNALILSDGTGRLQRFGADLRPEGEPLVTAGRVCQPLVWSVDARREIVFDVAGGTLVGGSPILGSNGKLDGAWSVTGSMPVMHIDAHGTSRLVVAEADDAVVYEAPADGAKQPLRIPLDYPPYLGFVAYGVEFRLLVNMRTGVHTMALANYDAAGRLLWKDEKKGAHPRLPAAADLNGDGRFEVLADDHGILQHYDAAGQVLATDSGWPPAYTLPIVGPFEPGGEPHTLRANGVSAISRVDGALRPMWETEIPNHRHYDSVAAIADTRGDGRLALGSLAEDGHFECFDTATGALRWSLDLSATPVGTSVVAGDVDGNGKEEYLVGLSDGRLVCIAEEGTEGRFLWQLQFAAAVANPIIADVDGDQVAEIVVSTADGYVRILRD